MGVCRRTWTVPVPWQSGHTSGDVPGAQPLPWQVSQASYRSTVTSFSQPKAASSKLMAMGHADALAPLGGVGIGAPSAAEPAAEEAAEDVPQVAEVEAPVEPAAEAAGAEVGVHARVAVLVVPGLLSASERTS